MEAKTASSSRGGELAAQEPGELHDAFLLALGQAHLLRAAENFVPRHALQSVAKGSGMLGGYGDWMMLLRPAQARELQADCRIVAQLAKRAPECEKLLRRDDASARPP